MHKPSMSCTISTPGVLCSVGDLRCIQGDIRRDCGSLFLWFDAPKPNSYRIVSALGHGREKVHRLSKILFQGQRGRRGERGLMKLGCSSEQSYA